MASLKLIWYFLKPYKVQLFLLFVFVAITGGLEALNLAALYPVINYGLDLETTSFRLMIFFTALLDILAIENRLLASCVLLFSISVLAALMKVSYNYCSFRLSTKIIGDTQKRVFEQFVRADYNFYVKNQQGRLIHSGTVAPEYVSSVVLYCVKLAYDLVSTTLLFGLLLMLNVKATISLIFVGFVYVFFIKKVMAGFIYRSASITSQEDRNKNVVLNEVINGFRDIKIFLRFDGWRKKFYRTVDRGMYYKRKMLFGRTLPESAMKLIFFSILACFGAVISQYPYNKIILIMPVFGTFVVVASRLFPAIQLVGNSFMILADCMPNSKIVYDLCTMDIATIPNGNKKINLFDDQIVFDNVSFKYEGMEDNLLNKLSFSIKKKEVTALVGPSGCGKTTIISLLLRLYLPIDGVIKIDGTNIFDVSSESYFSKIGFVGQDTFIFNGSIRDNICFGLPDCTDAMIQEVAVLANADKFINETPDGYQTVVGDAGIKLSGGQKQRIAIARAMLKKPEIIIMDEATSSLDNISEKRIQEAINRISKYTTIFVIAHRLTTVKKADKIIILDKGEIQEQGVHVDLMKSKNLYHDLHKVTTEGAI